MNSTSPNTAHAQTELLTEAELARRLKTTVASVRWMRRSGRLTFVKIAGNRKVRFSWLQVLEDLRACEVKAQTGGTDQRARQLAAIAESGDEDNAECAAADLAREFSGSGGLISSLSRAPASRGRSGRS